MYQKHKKLIILIIVLTAIGILAIFFNDYLYTNVFMWIKEKVGIVTTTPLQPTDYEGPIIGPDNNPEVIRPD